MALTFKYLTRFPLPVKKANKKTQKKMHRFLVPSSSGGDREKPPTVSPDESKFTELMQCDAPIGYLYGVEDEIDRLEELLRATIDGEQDTSSANVEKAQSFAEKIQELRASFAKSVKDTHVAEGALLQQQRRSRLPTSRLLTCRSLPLLRFWMLLASPMNLATSWKCLRNSCKHPKRSATTSR